MKQIRKVEPIPFTQEGYEQLKKEYDTLTEQRKDAVEHLRRARELGDLRENGYYKASRMKLSSIDHRLTQLKFFIRFGVISEKPSGETVQIGSTVIVQEEEDQRQFMIVGKYEANPQDGKLSDASPLGRALLNKKIGDGIEVDTPSWKKVYHIISIH